MGEASTASASGAVGSSSKGQGVATVKHPSSVPALLDSLRSLQADNPKAVRSTVHIYPASVYAPGSSLPDRHITSWKLTEHMFFKANNPFPTLARGLFTEALAEDGSGALPDSARASYDGHTVKERIVARGYDKFFNINETKHTDPPFYLTLKSNGCLIMITALNPDHLLVASKHSLGTTVQEFDEVALKVDELSVQDQEKHTAQSQSKEDVKGKQKAKPSDDGEARQHAEVGREWVKRTLDRSGKSEAQLARRLWDENLTAVLELCDDSFEEHVIATPEHWTGLHLHGLNYNTPHFATKLPAEVTAFAQDFGFIPTKCVELESVANVQAFTSNVAQTGSWEGDMIEGFVVRATVKDLAESSANPDSSLDDRPPYRPGAPFFFKVKFEEPYLLYRQWREVTRAMLPLLAVGDDADAREKVWKTVRGKLKRPEVEVYAEWCDQAMQEEPALFDKYDKGVVRVRERFLAWADGEGKERWDAARSGRSRVKGKGKSDVAAKVDKTRLAKKWLVVPISIPGSGKTSIGVGLSKLYGVGHTQSDDITTKKSAAGFLKNITTLLKTHDVVYADRNNSIVKHYDELAKLAEHKELKDYNVRLIAVTWDVDELPYHHVLRLCSERVVARGDNHQTLRPDPTDDHERIVGKFLRNYVPPDPTMFDAMIHVDLDASPRVALQTVASDLASIIGLQAPMETDIDQAVQAASSYKTDTPYHGEKKHGTTPHIRYYGLAPELDLEDIATQFASLGMPEAAAQSARAFVDGLREKKRFTTVPHVTLAHENNVQAEKEGAVGAIDPAEHAPGPEETAWRTCQELAASHDLYAFDLIRVVWDDRTMALVLEALRPRAPETPVLQVSSPTKEYLHVTVGTQSEDIRPFESRGVIRKMREAEAAGLQSGQAGEVVEGGGALYWTDIGPISGQGMIKGMW